MSSRSDFLRGVRAKMKSRSSIYALLFILLMVGQQIYEARKDKVSETGDPATEAGGSRAAPSASREPFAPAGGAG